MPKLYRYIVDRGFFCGGIKSSDPRRIRVVTFPRKRKLKNATSPLTSDLDETRDATCVYSMKLREEQIGRLHRRFFVPRRATNGGGPCKLEFPRCPSSEGPSKGRSACQVPQGSLVPRLWLFQRN